MKLNGLDMVESLTGGRDLMPVLFLGHGSPMNAIEDNTFTQNFRLIGKKIGKPKAILCISAHWETRGTHLTAMEHPRTIHDFSGFPPALYEVQYPAPGSPELAGETRNLIRGTKAVLSDRWGLDHGAWSVIRHMYPEADIPVVQMSIDHTKTPLFHYDLGREMSGLRKKGVLIIGSGNLVHNLRSVAWDKIDTPGYSYDWATEARSKMNRWILEGDHPSLIKYEKQGGSIQMAIPTPEHFLPLLYVLGLKGKDEVVELFNDQVIAGSVSMTSVHIHHP